MRSVEFAAVAVAGSLKRSRRAIRSSGVTTEGRARSPPERQTGAVLPFALAYDPDASAPEAGRALLRRLAAELLGIAPEDVPLTQQCPDCGGPHGRPEIAASELRVSLARCPLGAVAVAAWGADIGVDVEPLAQTPARLTAIEEVAGGTGIARWTRVEAVLKADGRGLRVDPRGVRIEGDIATIAGDPARYRIVEPAIDTPLQVSVALAL